MRGYLSVEGVLEKKSAVILFRLFGVSTSRVSQVLDNNNPS